MPIYEYECPKCNHIREVERKIDEPELPFLCVHCNCEYQRRWSAPGVVFNGPGFYKTDNAK